MNHKQNLETYDPKKVASFDDRLEVYKATFEYLLRNPQNQMGLCWLLITYYLRGTFDVHDLQTFNLYGHHIVSSNTTVTFPELLKLVPDMHTCYANNFTHEERERFLLETIRAMEAVAEKPNHF